MDREEAVAELKQIYAVLLQDLDSSLALDRERPSQFARRTVFRTYFAFIEGVCFKLREVTLASLESTGILTSGELALLREERFQLNHRGEPTAKENFQSFLPNLLFTLRCYAKNHGAVFEPDIGNQGWEAMKKSVAVRDRITHPKSAHGLEVSEEDVRTFGVAGAWWKATLLAMFAACHEADQFFRQQLQSGR